ncbi:MAG: tetratricopeptide repeat protein [Magnetococcales bacterium]|nr:tetratricopeptide repeat protein [Magnetococcales bacterium]
MRALACLSVLSPVWIAIPLLGCALLLLPTPAQATANLDDTLKAAAEALARNTLEEAEQLHGQVINAAGATRTQRATAFAGRCATRYKQGLSARNPALFPQAIDDCDRALELKSDLQQGYRVRGVALLSAGHPDRAAEDLSVAVALNPEDHLAFQNRALALAKLGRAREAMAELDAAIRLKPDHPWSYYNRGRLRISQGDYEGSIDDFIAFIRFKRDYDEVYRLRGLSRLWIGLSQPALEDFYEALRLRPDNAEALLARGMTFCLLGRLTEAEQDLTEFLKKQPGHVEAHLWLHLTHVQGGKKDPTLLTNLTLRPTPNSWPEAMVAVFLGARTADHGLEAARASEDPVERRLREHQTLLMLALQARGTGGESEAVRYLERIQPGQEREAPFYRLARQLTRQGGENVVTIPPENKKNAAALNNMPDAKPESSPFTTKKPEKKPPSATPELPTDQAVSKTVSKPVEKVAEKSPEKTPPRPAVVTVSSGSPPPPPPPTSSVADGTSRFYFIAGSYSNQGYANIALTRCLELGLPAQLEQRRIQDKSVHRVVIGPFDDPARAKEARDKVLSLPDQHPGEITKR